MRHISLILVVISIAIIVYIENTEAMKPPPKKKEVLVLMPKKMCCKHGGWKMEKGYIEEPRRMKKKHRPRKKKRHQPKRKKRRPKKKRPKKKQPKKKRPRKKHGHGYAGDNSGSYNSYNSYGGSHSSPSLSSFNGAGSSSGGSGGGSSYQWMGSQSWNLKSWKGKCFCLLHPKMFIVCHDDDKCWWWWWWWKASLKFFVTTLLDYKIGFSRFSELCLHSFTNLTRHDCPLLGNWNQPEDRNDSFLFSNSIIITVIITIITMLPIFLWLWWI